MTLRLSLFIILVSLSFADAQEIDDTDFQSWFDIRTIYKFSDKLIYDGDQGIRTLFGDLDWTLIYIRPAINYRYHRILALRGGVNLVYTSQKLVSNSLEVRPWQGLQLFWPTLVNFTVDHYFRLEERVEFSAENWASDFDFRGRYRVRLKTANYRLKSGHMIFYFSAAVEFFGNLGEGLQELFVNRNRIYLAIGYFMNSDLWFELNYIRQGSGFLTEGGFKVTEHVLRLRVMMNLN